MNVTVTEIRTHEGRVVGVAIWPRGTSPAKLELYDVAYAGDGAELTGVQVIDEFETMSGPLMIAPIGSLGDCYDAALDLAFERSAELEIGSGWPPVIVGLDLSVTVSPGMLERKDADRITSFRVAKIEVLVTDRELKRGALRDLARRSSAELAVAISTGKLKV